MQVLREWDSLPGFVKKEAVYPYYCALKKKEKSICQKRLFDVVASSVLIIALAPLMAVIAIWIKVDSKGPVFFRQKRVTQYGRKFNIYKFRTMVDHAEQFGNQVTAENDERITHAGKKLRKVRLDEFPQLFNILIGDMTFVGTRPEVPKYVKQYSDEMCATLLLPAGVTSYASMQFKDEDRILAQALDVEQVYIREVLPEKMKYNLASLEKFSCIGEISIICKTVLSIVGKGKD